MLFCPLACPQIEQSIKLCRFLACTAAGTAASAGSSAAAAPVLEALKTQLKTEVDAAVGFILENLAALSLMEDKAVALSEASQVGVGYNNVQALLCSEPTCSL